MAHKKGMRAAVNEFFRNIQACEREEVVIAHAQTIFDAKAAGVPAVDGRHGACVRSDQGRKGQTAVTVFTDASGNRRNASVSKPPEQAFALTAVVDGVFPEGRRQRVARSCRYHSDAEVGPDTLAVGSSKRYG